MKSISNFKIDTEGTELLPNMTHSYDITGHASRRGTYKQANWPKHFLSVYISKGCTHPYLKFHADN